MNHKRRKSTNTPDVICTRRHVNRYKARGNTSSLSDVKMKTILDELDELLINMGKYPNKEELYKDALRALLRAKPDLRRDMAVELYKEKIISLSRAAEIYGSNIEDFKELRKEKGIKIEVPSIPVEEVDREVESILQM